MALVLFRAKLKIKIKIIKRVMGLEYNSHSCAHCSVASNRERESERAN